MVMESRVFKFILVFCFPQKDSDGRFHRKNFGNGYDDQSASRKLTKVKVFSLITAICDAGVRLCVILLP